MFPCIITRLLALILPVYPGFQVDGADVLQQALLTVARPVAVVAGKGIGGAGWLLLLLLRIQCYRLQLVAAVSRAVAEDNLNRRAVAGI